MIFPEEAELLGQQRDRREGDPISDPDDRVESDILAARLVTEPRDDFPDNNDLIAEPVRHYRHSPNRDLNTLLTAIALTAIGFALGIAVGHSVGEHNTFFKHPLVINHNHLISMSYNKLQGNLS